MPSASEPPVADPTAARLSGENLTLPASPVADAVFVEPAWTTLLPPDVEIVWTLVASIGEMYAFVVTTKTTTASAALKLWLPLSPVPLSDVFDFPSAWPAAEFVCCDLP